MVSIDRITAGIGRYLDREILPQLPQVKAIALGTAAALYLRQAPSLIAKIPASMGIVDGSMIDIDAVRECAIGRIQEPVSIDIPLVGRMTFDQTEIDKLYRYIMDG